MKVDGPGGPEGNPDKAGTAERSGDQLRASPASAHHELPNSIQRLHDRSACSTAASPR
jgi:hypothetical protein